jgi:hypothetical protein
MTGRARVNRVQLTQERAEEIIRALQPLAQEDQIRALAGQLRRMLSETKEAAR